MSLGESVHGAVEQLGRGVRLIPALVALAVEAKVGGQVHDLQAALASAFTAGAAAPCG